MTDKLRIAFEIDLIPHYRKTFYEKLCANHQYEWCVYYGSTNPEAGRPSLEGNFDFPNVPLVNRLVHFGSFRIRWQSGILQKIFAYNPDILIVTGISGILSNWILLLWAVFRKKKRIIWSCGWEAQALGTFALRIKRTFLRIYLSMANEHLVYGTRAANYLSELGISPEKITVCYNGIEIDHLLRQEDEIRCEGQ